MPNFKKSDGFALGGSPFTMKKGSKEINTDGSFRQEAMGKMGSYGSPLFAIQARDAMKSNLAYHDGSPFAAIEGRQGRGDGSQVDTTSDLGADVDAGLAQGKEIAGALGLDEDEDEEDSPVDQTMQALTADKAKDAFKNSGSMATNSLTEGIIK